jgi:hypothetical protein
MLPFLWATSSLQKSQKASKSSQIGKKLPNLVTLNRKLHKAIYTLAKCHPKNSRDSNNYCNLPWHLGPFENRVVMHKEPRQVQSHLLLLTFLAITLCLCKWNSTDCTCLGSLYSASTNRNNSLCTYDAQGAKTSTTTVLAAVI